MTETIHYAMIGTAAFVMAVTVFVGLFILGVDMVSRRRVPRRLLLNVAFCFLALASAWAMFNIVDDSPAWIGPPTLAAVGLLAVSIAPWGAQPGVPATPAFPQRWGAQDESLEFIEVPLGFAVVGGYYLGVAGFVAATAAAIAERFMSDSPVLDAVVVVKYAGLWTVLVVMVGGMTWYVVESSLERYAEHGPAKQLGRG